jgi:hypothetical protein
MFNAKNAKPVNSNCLYRGRPKRALGILVLNPCHLLQRLFNYALFVFRE